MKIAKLYSFDDIRIEERPKPTIGAGEILVRMQACGICSGDVLPWYIEKKAPLVLGHEPAGIVAEVGEGVTKFKAGDRVVLHHHAPCMQCHLCQKKLYTMCPTWRKTNLDPGGMAEYVRVPKVNTQNDTLLIANDTSFEAAALVEPVACCVKALETLAIKRQDSLVILGLGVMGILNIITAKYYGIKQIIAVDCVPSRLQRALEVGATTAVDFKKENLVERIRQLTNDRLADKIIVGPGTIQAMESAMNLAGIGSTICLFTTTQPNETWSINPFKLYFEDITIKTSYSCGPEDMQKALKIVESKEHPFPIDKVITHRYPLEKTKEAFERMAARGDALKVMVHFPTN